VIAPVHPPAALDGDAHPSQRVMGGSDRYLGGQRRAQLAQPVRRFVPRPKTDVSDAQWLCRPLEAGLLKPSLVPPKPIRRLRNLTRYRKSNIRDRQREAARLHKMLEDSGIKLGCVATDIMGKSGRAMLDALVSGTTDPVVLAELARGQLRKKIPALREALVGRFDQQHALIVGPDPGSHRLPRRGDRAAVRSDRAADRPFRPPA
jgi:transposase